MPLYMYIHILKKTSACFSKAANKIITMLNTIKQTPPLCS